MITSLIWNAIPGPAILRVLLLLIVLAAVVFVLFEYVFPWISTEFNLQDTTVGGT